MPGEEDTDGPGIDSRNEYVENNKELLGADATELDGTHTTHLVELAAVGA